MTSPLLALQKSIGDNLGDTPFIKGFSLVAGFLFTLPILILFLLYMLWEPLEAWRWGIFMGIQPEAWLGFWGNILSGLVAALTAFYILFASIGYEAYTWGKNRSHEVSDRFEDLRISIGLEISEALDEIVKPHGHNADAFYYLSQKLRRLATKVSAQLGWQEVGLGDAVAAMREASSYFREYATANSARRAVMQKHLVGVSDACYSLVEGLIEGRSDSVSDAKHQLAQELAESGVRCRSSEPRTTERERPAHPANDDSDSDDAVRLADLDATQGPHDQ